MSIVEALNPKKPNALHLLGKELVAWRTDEGEWVCMDDQCSHRLAPLSGLALPCCTLCQGCCAIITKFTPHFPCIPHVSGEPLRHDVCIIVRRQAGDALIVWLSCFLIEHRRYVAG